MLAYPGYALVPDYTTGIRWVSSQFANPSDAKAIDCLWLRVG